jgi:hypothetical protein
VVIIRKMVLLQFRYNKRPSFTNFMMYDDDGCRRLKYSKGQKNTVYIHGVGK